MRLPPHPRNPAIHFRSALPQDAAAIRELVRAAYAKWVPLIGREPMPMKADYDRAVAEHQIDMLHADGKFVGLIETLQHADHLWIENVAVHPDSQGQGHGQRLLAEAERRAAESGRAEIRLVTNGEFESNIALYGKVDYRVDRREPFLGGTAVYMSKVIGG
jgi:ribosomal protein S18 acetylase RimI-like enzyme